MSRDRVFFWEALTGFYLGDRVSFLYRGERVFGKIVCVPSSISTWNITADDGRGFVGPSPDNPRYDMRHEA